MEKYNSHNFILFSWPCFILDVFIFVHANLNELVPYARNNLEFEHIKLKVSLLEKSLNVEWAWGPPSKV